MADFAVPPAGRSPRSGAMSRPLHSDSSRSSCRRAALARGAAAIAALASLLLVAAPALAQGPTFGLRFGASVDPDQLVLGFHVKTSEVAPSLYFVPSGTVGFGDDITTFQANADVHYDIPMESSPWVIYAGGGFGLAAYSDGGDETGAGVNFIFGAESHYRARNSFLAEVRVALGNLPDVEFLFGVSFR